MKIADFALERYFARWEFAVRHVLCASDVEGWPMADLLALADDEARGMWDGLRLGYTESTGHPALRREIATLYDSIEADDVLVFAGAEEAIYCLLSTSLGPEDHVIPRDFPARCEIAFTERIGPFVVEGAGHYLQWERADVLNQTLVYFLADLRG